MSISDRIREGIEDVLVDYGNEREDAAYSHRVRPDLAGSVDKIMALLAPAPLHEEWGSISMASGAVFRAPTLSAALDRTPAGGQVARRYVTDWEPADGDRGDQP